MKSPKLTESAPDVSKWPGGGESVVNGSWWDAEHDEQDVRDLSWTFDNQNLFMAFRFEYVQYYNLNIKLGVRGP